MLRLIVVVAFAAIVEADYRILNGNRVNIEDYPYQASVLYGWDQIGGGVIIAPRHVLTAAHLKAGSESIDRLKVRVGSPHAYSLGVVHIVKRFVTYGTPVEKGVPINDIGVITLHDPINFNERAQPIPLVPEGEEPRHGEMLTATGWGGTEFNVDSVELRMALLPCIDRGLCNKAWKAKSSGLVELPKSALCAGGGTTSTFPGVYPNVSIALRMLLTIPVTNCSGERPFSVLKRVKNCLRSVTKDERLSPIALLAIEKDITKNLNCDEIISVFVEKKRRKKLLK